MKLVGSPGCGAHEMVEFEILRAVEKGMLSELETLDSRGADFGLCRSLHGRVAWDKDLAGSGGQELGGCQGSSPPRSKARKASLKGGNQAKAPGSLFG